eukprot:SAG31_NODE_17_length_35773_cov_25.999271_14_plen_44_part_00
MPIVDEILNLPGIQIGLVAGGGRLFVIKTHDDSIGDLRGAVRP